MRTEQAQRVYNYYRLKELELLKVLDCCNYEDAGLVNKLVVVQKRRAFAAGLLRIGRYT